MAREFFFRTTDNLPSDAPHVWVHISEAYHAAPIVSVDFELETSGTFSCGISVDNTIERKKRRRAATYMRRAAEEALTVYRDSAVLKEFLKKIEEAYAHGFNGMGSL